MADYDFGSLNDKEFEALSIDLLARASGRRIERFKPGRDKGVDGRFYSSQGQETVIQCKHWLKSGLNALLRSIERSEADKVRKLSPSRYIFVTSVELSRANKVTIKNLFAPHILSDSDVLGNEDVNDLLSNYADVERKHYKLWISSTTVLQTILSSGIIGRSKSKLEEIVEESSRYVVTKNHTEALRKLEKLHSVIITGAPGSGKTTLADQLCQAYAAKGYEFLYVENSLNEAESAFDENFKQIFYFDDFLGRNFLLALAPHQDSHIINFINRVRRASGKRFVLTTRSNIFNQGRGLSDLFEIKQIDKNEYKLSVSDLTELDKAKLLYNHIWFGRLANEFIDELYEKHRYLKIVRHDNFNPRLIAFVTDHHRIANVEPSRYWQHIEKNLNNPENVWRNVLEVQLERLGMHLSVGVALNGQSVPETLMRSFFSKLIQSNLCSTTDHSYDATIRLLVGAILNRNVGYDSKVRYTLFDPSIADFVIANYLLDFIYIDQVLYCLQSPHAVDNLVSLRASDVISDEYCLRLLESQLSRLSESNARDDFDRYKLGLMNALSEKSIVDTPLRNYIEHLCKVSLRTDSSGFGTKYYKFLSHCLSSGLIKSSCPNLLHLCEEWVLNNDKDLYEFAPLSEIVEFLGLSKLASALGQQYVEFISEDITNDIIQEGLYSNIYEHGDYSERELLGYIDSRLSELAISFGADEVREIANCFDLDKVIDGNRETMHDGTGEFGRYEGSHSQNEASTSEILDLFDRS